MVKLSELMRKLHNGDPISDKEITDLMHQLYNVQQALTGTGDLFYSNLRLVNQDLGSVVSICESRKINSDPKSPTCPHCFKKLELPECAKLNVATYGRSALLSTECCSKPIRLSMATGFRTTKTTTSNDEDDWGKPFKK